MEEFPKEPNVETKDIESSIEGFLETLDDYYPEFYEKVSPELQQQWYYVHLEGSAGKDRQQAEARLREFVDFLEKLIKEKNL
jgi:hypothetical protein